MIPKDVNKETRGCEITLEKIEAVEDMVEHVHQRADRPLQMDQPPPVEEDLVAAVPVDSSIPHGDPLA